MSTLNQGMIAQPRGGAEYRSLLDHAFRSDRIRRFDSAVAYATFGGVECLVDQLHNAGGEDWLSARKRWLVGIDWIRSEPRAIDVLERLKFSTVRVHDGATVVLRSGCTPRLPYHPKTFIVTGAKRLTAVLGSGNLSRNGMLHGHEVGIALAASRKAKGSEARTLEQILYLQSWFSSLWSIATPWSRIRKSYLSQYKARSNFKSLTPTDDDSADSTTLALNGRLRGFSPAELKQLRAASNFWIEAGVLSKNRGKSLPGNQLMMKRFTRVFFGIPARDVPTDTNVGTIAVRYGSHLRNDCTIRYSNNSMDVLTLPVPGSGGPPTYDNRILHFERRDDGTFTLRVLPKSSRSLFRKRSMRLDAAFKMSSGRQFGVY